MRHGTIATGTDLPREALGFGQVETRDQLLSLSPTKLIDRNGNVGRSHAASGFSAAGTVAMRKSDERRCHLIAHGSAKTTSMELLIRHAASVYSYFGLLQLMRTDRALQGGSAGEDNGLRP